MARKNLKMRVDDEGRLEVVDPGFDTLELIHSIDPGFEIKTAPLPLFSVPRFQNVRKMGSGLSLEYMKNETDDDLWDLHNQLLDRLPIAAKPRQTNEASLLDIKIELAYRLLKSCQLCGRRCGVNRTIGEKGICGLGMETIVFEHFIHIAEEPHINPSLVVMLGGCSLQCCFCQQEHLLKPSLLQGDNLDKSLWKKINTKKARSLSFVGGNPDESLYAIIRFLANAPDQWVLPIVWNCNSYAALPTVKLLHGLVDVYISDFKFGHSNCGDELAHASNYWESAKSAISGMLEQAVPVIIRILLLPGHYHCCQKPILNFLAQQSFQVNLLISIRDQYYPNHYVNDVTFGEMNRRVNEEEVLSVIRYAKDLHLNVFKQ